MNLNDIKRVFFIGIGGIGMSALARYFNRIGKMVAGYDSTPTSLTAELSNEGIAIHHEDNINRIPKDFLDNPNELLVIYTPAIPKDHKEFNYLLRKKNTVIKRAKALGLIANDYATAAISGTHGKTSTSTMLAYLLSKTPQRCDAFLGGISKNFNGNLVLGDKGANRLVVEADEFDRSFLSLNPQLAIVTSVDADHLDIYDDHAKVKEAFEAFVSNITPGGVLIIKKGLEEIAGKRKDISIYTYSGEERADFYPENVSHKNGFYSFDLITPFGNFEKISLGVLGRYNVENAIAASAAALIWGISDEVLQKGLFSFKGISRRFDLRYKSKRIVYIDDYAHHPKELSAAIGSLKEIFPNRRITGIFQPHLYTRTRDFADEFAESLSQLDELIMLPIYPAREQPIAGVNSEMILTKVKCKEKKICKLDNLVDVLRVKEIDVLITLGAGNIDKVAVDIVNMLKEKEKK
jgi:UDP-N-acetylmuramate--alanine ligase